MGGGGLGGGGRESWASYQILKKAGWQDLSFRGGLLGKWGCSFLNWDILTFNRWNGVKDEKYYGGSLKNSIFRGGILKNQYIGEDCLKSGGLDSLSI